MPELVTEIEVDAPPADVWATLVDFAAYPEWNPYLRRVSGAPTRGARLEIEAERPGARTSRYSPRVIACDRERRLAWRSTIIAPQLFAILHAFELEPLADDRVRFVQRESFRGLLAPLGRRALRHARPSFEAMNRALKQRAESRGGSS